MKVSFKLNAAQLKIAEKFVEENQAFFEKKCGLLTAQEKNANAINAVEYQLYYQPELADKLASLKVEEEAIASELQGTDYKEYVWAGNCWKLYDHPSVNEDVCLMLTGNILTFEGDRYPLIYDGCLIRIFEIAGFEKPAAHQDSDLFREWYKSCCQQLPEVLRVVKYQTSERRFAWYQTCDGYMRSSATIEEIVEYKGATLDMFERFPDVLNNVRLYRKDPKRAHVFLTKAELALVKKVLKLECFN